jgi:hypothetical protein
MSTRSSLLLSRLRPPSHCARLEGLRACGQAKIYGTYRDVEISYRHDCWERHAKCNHRDRTVVLAAEDLQTISGKTYRSALGRLTHPCWEVFVLLLPTPPALSRTRRLH